MKRITILYWLTLLMCSVTYTQAQQRVKGTVTDPKGQAIEYVNVVVLNLPDSTFVSGTVTDKNGNFTLENLPQSCCLSFSSIGYKNRVTSIDNANRVVLNEDSFELGGVVVEAERPQIHLKEGALEMNVRGTTLAHRSNIMDILGQMPGLRKTTDGSSVSLITGGQLLIYLNGREIHQMDELSTIDIKNIKSIRLDNAPGSRYPAHVSAVLHIQTARDLSTLSLRLGSWIRQTHYLSNGEEVHLSYNQNKISYYGMASYGYRHKHYAQELKNIIAGTQGTDSEEQLQTSLTENQKFKELKAIIGSDFTPYEHLTCGIKYALNHTPYVIDMTDHSNAHIGSKLSDNILSRTLFDQITTTHHANAFSSWQPISKLNLTINANYFGKKFTRIQNTIEQSLLHHTTTPIFIHTVSQHDLWQGNAIMEYRLGEKHLIEFGSEMYKITGKSLQHYGEERRLVSNYTNDERIYAGIGSYNFTTAAGWNIQFGLRYEHSESLLHNKRTEGKDIARKWNDLFYSFKLSGSIGKTNHSLNFNSSIVRPTMEQLSNNTFRSNKYLIQESNPHLNPEHNYHFDYNFIFSNYYFSVNYTYHKDYIGPHMRANRSIPNGYILSTTNYQYAGELRALANMRKQWGPYDLSATALYQYNHIDGKREGFSLKPKPLYYLQLTNGFTLPKGYYISIEYSYQSATTTEIFQLAQKHLVNVYANKNFLNDKLQVSLSFTDILKTGGNYVNTSIGGIHLNMKEYADSRSITLNITYRFNNEKQYKGKETAMEAINRL